MPNLADQVLAVALCLTVQILGWCLHKKRTKSLSSMSNNYLDFTVKMYKTLITKYKALMNVVTQTVCHHGLMKYLIVVFFFLSQTSCLFAITLYCRHYNHHLNQESMH